MKAVLVLVGAALVSVSAAVGLVRELGSRTTTHTEGDWGDFFDGEQLVAASELIVVGELRSQSTQQVVFPSPTNPDSRFVRTDLIQTFDVIDVLKGDYREKSIDRRVTVSHDFEGNSTGRGKSTLEVEPVEPGRTYVLFLTSYPVDDTRTAWGPPGQPGVGEIDGDRVFLRGTERYGEEVDARGLPRASSRSEAPFEMTLTELRGR